MYMRFMSDIHLEFGAFIVPPQDTDSETVLVLAGDIGVAAAPTTFKEFILDVVSRFKLVIWIMGNHEHYGGSLERTFVKIKRAVGEPENLILAENAVVPFGGYQFICATLWTDFNNGNPMAEMEAQVRLNDYKRIRTGPEAEPYLRKLLAGDTRIIHERSICFIIDALKEANNYDRPTVVVSHHAPSYQSVPMRYKSDPCSPAFASSLDSMIQTMKPNYWIHGHIHDSSDYNIGKTNVLCNPRGYWPSELNVDFDPNWKIEL